MSTADGTVAGRQSDSCILIKVEEDHVSLQKPKVGCCRHLQRDFCMCCSCHPSKLAYGVLCESLVGPVQSALSGQDTVNTG